MPTIDEIISQLNLRASSGLPEPWFKKQQFRKDIFCKLQDILNCDFSLFENISNVSSYSAAFKRFQITDNKLKARLVFCVNYVINICEAPLDMCFKRIIVHRDCPFIHGRSQLDLSDLMMRHKKYYNVSFDAVAFDNTVPGEIMALAFHSFALCLGLSNDSYWGKMLNDIRDVLLCMPCFHPALNQIRRKRGLVSGSGLTSSIGSLCMYSMHFIAFLKYCNMHKINLNRMFFKIVVSSDDSMIFSNFEINPDKYMAIFKRTFGMDLELETSSLPHHNKTAFLGSTWVNSKPYRNINRMLSRIMFGNPNIPKFESEYLLFCSRAYEILGNVANFHSIWKDFKIPLSGRILRLTELSDYNQRVKIDNMNLLDKRGYWETRNIGECLDSVWSYR
jgi:hypothetical protein